MAKQHDFTEGNIVKQLFISSAPIILTNLLQISYQFIDSLWIGNLIGADALGAVAISGTIVFTVLSFVIGLNNAALTILSQQKGKGSEEGLKRYLNAFVVMLTLMSISLGIAGYVLSEHILSWLGTPETMVPMASAYLKINFIGMLFLFGYNFIGTVYRSVGDSKTPLYFVLTAVILNTILDPVFISVFGWGIEGAAYATILSQGVAFGLGVYFTVTKNLVPFSKPSLPSKQEVGSILKLGIPAGLQMSVISAGSMAIMSVVASFGAPVVAGYGASQRLDSLIMLPAQALGVAVNSMAGQNIGANKWERVHKITFYGFIYNLGVMIVLASIMFLFATYGIRLFIQEPDAVEFGTKYLKMVAFFYPFLGINFILNGAVRAAGAMFQVLILNIISFWILRFPLTYTMSSIYGEKGIALGIGISFVISSLFAFLYYRFGRWRRAKVIN
ncbi:MATE family efflux transporter [Sporosarcina pasteurii]|uniref:Staphylococcal virulence regulator protein A n=1 Tax=Sporosarcina pasteurii TaxID=1474 RepID=A0A380CEU6_SPOPA|nr:MATE family efflux transporter [Sporosarcina pasteurii]MDS9473239.1 MATE family efflux transporter [Sporosarcina pasteurii]QBQ06969.1 MATE family efflux transporter [Sporosarcina pasteurii]SUJ17820.1 Staphylococcal virulence regulator protein A [Sporosarcina pasteurii]